MGVTDLPFPEPAEEFGLPSTCAFPFEVAEVATAAGETDLFLTTFLPAEASRTARGEAARDPDGVEVELEVFIPITDGFARGL